MCFFVIYILFINAIEIYFCLLSGRASVFPDHKSSFVDGMGGKQVLDEMWPYVSHLVDDSIIVSLKVGVPDDVLWQ